MIIGLTGHSYGNRIMVNTAHIVTFCETTRDGQKVTHVKLAHAGGIDVTENIFAIAEMADDLERWAK